MHRLPCRTGWRVIRSIAAAAVTTPLSLPASLLARSSPACPCLRSFSRSFTHFDVAAVRLLRLTLLDKPTLALPTDHTNSSKQSNDGALTASSQQQSTACFIAPAVLHDTKAWERWLDGIDGEQTFIVSRTLLPHLFERLNWQHRHSDTTPQLTAAGSASAAPQLTLTADDGLNQANDASIASTEASATPLALLQQHLSVVQSAPLITLVAPQRQRTKQQRSSTAIPPAPSVQSPLTQQQMAIFDAIPTSELSTIASLYSSSVMPVDQPHPTHGGTVLHVAAMHNRAEVVQWLLSEHRAEPNSRAFNHSTPLHWAAGNDAIASLRALLSHGADPTLTSMTHHSNTVGKGSGQTALHWAAESGHVESVRLLSEWAPQLVAVEDERGRAAKELAEAEGRTEVARLARQLESEEYVGVKVELAYRGQRIVGAHRKEEKASTTEQR